MTKKELLEYGEKLGKELYPKVPGDVRNNSILSIVHFDGLKLAIELLWPLVEALEICSVPGNLGKIKGARQALTDLEKKIEGQ